MSIFTENDMIFTNKNNKMSAGGYEVNIPFLNNNIPVSYSLNTSESMFGGLVIPSGLLYLTPDSKLTTEMKTMSEMNTMSGGGEITLNDKLYDKLFQLAQLGGSENQVEVQDQDVNKDQVDHVNKDQVDQVNKDQVDQVNKDQDVNSEVSKIHKKKTKNKKILKKRTRKLQLRPSI